MLTLRKIEAVTVGANSKPKLPILISQCGVRGDPGRLPRRGEAHGMGWGHNELRAIRGGVGGRCFLGAAARFWVVRRPDFCFFGTIPARRSPPLLSLSHRHSPPMRFSGDVRATAAGAAFA